MNYIRSKLDNLSMPDPRFFPDNLERKHQSDRNKVFLTMLFVIVILLTVNLISENDVLNVTHCCFVLTFAVIIAVFCWTRHLNPLVFKVFYAIVLTLIGPFCLYTDEGGIFAGLATTHLSPLFLLFFCDTRFLYFLQIGIQIFILEFLYKGEIRAMNLNTVSRFADEMTGIALYTILAQAFIMFKLTKMLEKSSRQELILEEKKRKNLEVQRTFILSFSHEIRNLINTLIGNIQLSLLEKTQPKVKGFLEDAEVGASLLIQLINNILDSGNMDVGDLEMNSITRVMHNTLEKMWTMCAHLLKTKNLKGQLRISRNLPKNLKIDHERLLQILINLIANAVKFTEQGSVDIKIEWIKNSTSVQDEDFLPIPFDDENEGLFEKDQALSVLRNEFMILGSEKKRWSADRYNTTEGSGPGVLKITNADTGYGVLSENLSHVFDRFSGQVFGDSSAKRLGTTIGLYVTKELCNRMGGDIKAFSKLNRGTAFIVCLPAEQIADEVIPMNIRPLPQQKLRAMIVDDLDFNIVVLTNYLQRMKVDIADTAEDGNKAYTKYVQSVRSGNPFDIVTMDVEMPVMDGKESARKIREYERENSLKPCFLVMISGNVCESEISQCLRYEGRELANYFLKKPATFDDLSRLIAQQFKHIN